jgi:hypothetical protein
MLTNQFSFIKSKWYLLPFAFLLFSLMVASSCNPGSNSKNPTCVKLTKAQFQKWVKSGYTNSKNKDYISAVQFRTAYAFPGTIFKVYVIGQRADGTFVNESLTELKTIDTCKTAGKLSEFIFLGTLPATIAELGVFNSDGNVIDSFEYLKMDPYNFNDPTSHYDYLAYNVSVVTKSAGRTTTAFAKAQIGLPCPPCPNCNPSACPKPPTCITCGPDATDSTEKLK